MSKDLKYKIGDRVRMKVFEKKPKHWNTKMPEWMGKIVTIRNANQYNFYPYAIKENDFGYYESDFSLLVDLLDDDLFEI